MTKEIKGIECRFVTHVPTKSSDIPDFHLIKEHIHYTDGTSEPNLKFVRDFKRPYWVTRRNKQNHKDKKEWEKTENLLQYTCTESELRQHLAKALGKPWSRESLRELCYSPYVYGAEITSSVFIKQAYLNKYPDVVSRYSYATFDVETDMVNGTEKIIMASLIYKGNIYTAIEKKYLEGFSSVIELISQCTNKYIKEHMEKYNLKLNVFIVENNLEIIRTLFNKAHELKPDFISIWNMDFDVRKCIETCKEHNIDPKYIFSDPNVPDEFKYFDYKPGPTKKVTASGTVKPVDIAARWNVVTCTSSFYFIDAMCSYRHLRLSKQEEPAYKLDYILQKELGIRKLKFKEADGYEEATWHKFMQTHYKIEYIVYNIFDCISMIDLEEKLKDISSSLPDFSRASEFSSFKSQPKRIIDAFFFERLSKGYVVAAAGVEPRHLKNKQVVQSFEDEFDLNERDDEDEGDEEYETLSLKGWIVTLPSHMIVYGINCIDEDATLRTLIRAFVFDSDSVSAYPTVIACLNISKETTKRELIRIGNIDEQLFRMQNLNIVQGEINSLEYCNRMFNFPKPYEMADLI